jgi:CheY-like chemotaxis protein
MQVDSQKPSGYLILIVDDEPNIRDMKRLLLEEEGFRVVEAENGREGVEVAIRKRPRLILMNCLMPLMDGLEATEAIRREPELKRVPSLMTSAFMEKEMRDRALLAGCNDYLEEPCDCDELIDKVMAHLLVG